MNDNSQINREKHGIVLLHNILWSDYMGHFSCQSLSVHPSTLTVMLMLLESVLFLEANFYFSLVVVFGMKLPLVLVTVLVTF